MEIKVTYADYDKSIKEANIDFEEQGSIELKFNDVVIGDDGDCPEEDIIQDEETGELRIIKIDTSCEPKETIKMLTIVAKDDTILDGVENSVAHSDLIKIIALLQRMSKQM